MQKYGGSSLATPKHILRAAERIKSVKASGQDLVVVVSAMGRMTDHLISLARKTVRHPPQRELDMLMTAGERISMSLLAMALHQEGIPAISFTGSQSGILTTSDHTEARIVSIRAERIVRELGRGRVVIIAGFQGVSAEREVTTLGRGGSDTTAIALAAALGADACEILTDVDGLFSADPRLVPDAKLISSCSYDEALELASLGAKMHPRSLEVAKRFQVPLRIASSANQNREGTRVSQSTDKMIEQVMIRGIATKTGFVFLRAQASIDRFFAVARVAKVAVRFFTFGEQDVRCVIEGDKATPIASALTQASIPFEIQEKIALISAVGEGLSAPNDELVRFVEALYASSAPTLLLIGNSLSITAAIPQAVLERAAEQVHQALVGTEANEYRPVGAGSALIPERAEK